MRRFLAAISAFLTLSASGAEWQSLFNGRDLDGWSGDPRLWRVEEGVLTGETGGEGRQAEANTFLIWQGGEPEDFVLEFRARLSGENNSGVQYRSRVLDAGKWTVAGYQMDLHPEQKYLAMLYEEQGRGIGAERGQITRLREKPEVTGTLEVPEVKISDWNDYRIVARGQVLKHFINGKLAAEVHDLEESRRAAKGVLALQLHHGPVMKVEFTGLRLRVLDSGAEPVAHWIWQSESPQKNETVRFRREFHLPPDVAEATVSVTCDNWHQLWINGTSLGEGAEWQKPREYEVISLLKPGARNLVAVQGRNDDGLGGMALRLRATLKDGRKLYLITDGKWLCSLDAGEGWQNPDYDAGSWKPAAGVRKMGEDPWGAVIQPEQRAEEEKK